MDQPSTDAKPLRFVILCDSLSFEQWQAECLEEVMSSGHAIPVGLVMRAPKTEKSGASKWKKRWKDRRLTFWRLFNRFYMRRYSQAVRQKDLSALLGGVPQILDRPVKAPKGGEALGVEAIDFVRALQPDFILRFSYGILRGEILDLARYGIWSYHHGDPAKYRGQPPGFWEIAERSSVAGAILQVLNNELDAGKVLHRGYFQVTGHSYAKTRDALYMGSATWVRRVCADIRFNGWPVGGEEKEQDEQAKGPIYKQPTNLDMLRFLGTIFRAFLQNQITYRFHRQNWNCAAIAEKPAVISGLLGPEKQREALEKAIWMKPSTEEFYADPFGHILPDGKGIRVFFELFSWKQQRGEIASAEFDGSSFGKIQPTFAADTHLSYPFAYHWHDRPHIIPENSEGRDLVALHIDEDGTVADQRVIIGGEPLIDTSFIERDGKFWAFALLNGKIENTDLYLFFSDRLDGPWQAHPLNPVKTDIRSARPAGTPFDHEGRLYRPAQDCATHYGSAVTINEVVVLSETRYQEVPVSRLEPAPGDAYAYGIHTLSEVGDYTLIDGSEKKRVF